MDTRLTTTHRIWRSLGVTSVALTLVMTVGATSASAASPTACRVQNQDTGKTFTALQAAVDAARPGDRLTVRGICRGTTVIDRDLVIAGIRTGDSGKPTLSGASRETIERRRSGKDYNCGFENGQRVRVVEVTAGARVTLRDLVITRGRAVRGAGIRNRGDLTLRDVQVRGNILDPHEFTGWGAGVYNEGRLRLNGGTRIALNQSTCDARDEVFNRDTIVMNGSSSIGSLGNTRDATLTMNGTSSLRGRWDGQLGNLGRVTMNDASWVGLTTAAEMRMGTTAERVSATAGRS